MTRRKAPLQVNQFTGGLNTESNPLNGALDTTQDEVNILLNRDGSREKRSGFDFEDSYVEVDTGVVYDDSRSMATSTFKWDNAGGDASKSLLVVQMGNHLGVYDLSNSPVSGDQIYERIFDTSVYTQTFSYAVVDGFLVFTTGEKLVKVLEYDAGSDTITYSEKTLYIRDLFGVQATISSVDLTLSQEVSTRPASSNDAHLYNLRNQTWGLPRVDANNETLDDTVAQFFAETGSTNYPSNADTVNSALLADPNDTNNRTVERFFPENLLKNPPGNTSAPKGFFIIDALERGVSRLAVESKLRTDYTDLSLSVTTLPTDTTPGGATCIAEFSGRVWYSGFSGELTGGDSLSPRMSSYVLFSRFVQDTSDINRCYQDADPTSNIDSALVDTDGGFIRVAGAYGIKRLVAVQGYLFVFAQNGVWRISGSEDTDFRATGYQVELVTNRSCESANSVVVVDNNIFFWSRDAIMTITRNQFGVWEDVNLSQQKIQSFYNAIPSERKRIAAGYYDDFSNTIQWVYSTATDGQSYSEELVFNTQFGAFTYNKINTPSGTIPKIVNVVETEPFGVAETNFIVTVGGVAVTVDGADVTTNLTVRSSTFKELIYIVLSDVTTNIKYSFGSYTADDNYDWSSLSNVDSGAYLITSPLTGGEPRSGKQSPFVHTYFRKTETAFDDNLELINPSSCLFSVQFNWTNSANANKWSTPRQAYRYNTVYIPQAANEVFDDGQAVIVTKNKVRGRGRSMSFKFEAEAGKKLHLYGWALDLDADSEE